MRSEKVKRLAHIYTESHYDELLKSETLRSCVPLKVVSNNDSANIAISV